MSAYIPFEIQVEVIKRVHVVKSLIRFTSVSKQWKSMIDNSEFITDHSVNQTQPHHILLRYNDEKYVRYIEDKFVSIVDDDSFPHCKFSPSVSATVKLVGYPSMLGCSHGLVCLFGLVNEKKLIVLWNPSIRKSVPIVLPGGFNVVGFGVCPKTSDPKIVTIKSFSKMDWQAEVFTLSSGTWRSIPINLRKPINSIEYKSEQQVVINGVIHWLAYSFTGSGFLIISFDLTSEEFGELDLPHSLARFGRLSISKFKESLALLDYDASVYDYYEGSCCVWVMNRNGDPKPSFTKLFTFSSKCYIIMGFRNNGQLITRHIRSGDYCARTTLEVYQPCIKHSNDLGTDEAFDLIFKTIDYPKFTMASYTESLILLNHSDSIIQYSDSIIH